jgi:Na+-driven multidrug efflux pump
MVLYFIVFYLFSDMICEMYTPDKEIQDKCKSAMFVIALYISTNAVRGVLRGSLVAFGM